MRVGSGEAARPTCRSVVSSSSRAARLGSLEPDATATFEPAYELDLWLTLFPLRRSGLNVSVRFAADGFWRATRTPGGPATEHVWQRDGAVHVEAWGPGAGWLVDHAPDLVGAADDDSDFTPQSPIVADLRRRLRGLRITRSCSVLEAVVATIAEQRVPGMEAWRAHRELVLRLGEPAPGPTKLRLPPAPEVLASTRYFVYHRFGLERRRAEWIRFAGAHAARLEEAIAMSFDEAHRRLRAFPGVGEWSAAEVALVALGDADAVPVGDYHFPHVVSWAFEGKRVGSDERMLELLEPFRGHRGRVLRYLEAAGIGPPRRGPRLPLHHVAQM